MTSTEFREATKRLTKPPGWTDEECSSLPVFCDGKECLSRWQPSWRERIAILFGAPVWLSVAGVTQPPVYLAGVHTMFERERWYRRAMRALGHPR